MEEDLKILAQLVHEIAMKYGDVYITVDHVPGFEHSGATIKPNDSDEYLRFTSK